MAVCWCYIPYAKELLMALPMPMRSQQLRQASSLSPLSATKTAPVAELDRYPAHPAALIQRARQAPRALRPYEVRQLQRTLGNQAVSRLLAQTAQPQSSLTQTPPQGLPEPLRAGIEHLSGLSMEDVTVHYNSAKPAQLQALAYTQGTEIYVAPGQ